jgi:ribosomal protein S18 acetylase RimI-like enzyme
MAITVRRAKISDAAALSRLAAETFRSTFEHTTSAENMDLYLADAYSPQKQASEISDPELDVMVAESDDGEMSGFAYVGPGETIEELDTAGVLELKRIYVAYGWHGQGVAQRLMDAALDAARARGARTIWLGVWENNARALGFYKKYGFERVSEHTFMVGDDAQTDWVLARSL